MSCEDVTADYPADTSAGIYDAGSYDRMMGDQDADEKDAEIRNKPLSRSVPLLFHISSDLPTFRVSKTSKGHIYVPHGLFTLKGRTRVQARIRIPNPMAALYYAEHVHIAEIQT